MSGIIGEAGSKSGIIGVVNPKIQTLDRKGSAFEIVKQIVVGTSATTIATITCSGASWVTAMVSVWGSGAGGGNQDKSIMESYRFRLISNGISGAHTSHTDSQDITMSYVAAGSANQVYIKATSANQEGAMSFFIRVIGHGATSSGEFSPIVNLT